MELQFQKQEVRALQCVLCQVQDLEQTQELRVPEGMPGVGRILGCWGQVLLRSKQWQRDSIRITGGTQLWVLYAPEDGDKPCSLNTWVPFQMDWDLPDRCGEGEINVLPMLRFSDARAVSAGKLMLRIGLAVQAQGWVPRETAVYSPGELPGEVELLRRSWPLRLPVEAGEKPFPLEETMELPSAAPKLERLLYCRMTPVVSDGKVLSDKLAFRGSGNLHILYLSENGTVHGWDFELPFSQYAELTGSHSTDAKCGLTMVVTSLEAEPDQDGAIHLKVGLTAQYLLEDMKLLELVEDAWCPFREIEIQRESAELSGVLDSWRETAEGQRRVDLEADIVADSSFLPDFPRLRREGDTLILEQGGIAQLLCYDREGKLRQSQERLESTLSTKADRGTGVVAVPVWSSLEAVPQGEGQVLRWETAVQVTATAGQGIPMVTGMTLGERQEPDPARPSLILRRAGSDRLWDIARESGSTVAAILEANGLESQPAPDRMLLIPVV